MVEGPSRKLAVLLHADVVDSTALVQLDETLAHQRIQGAFRRFSEIISSHEGTAREIRGDALVAEFAKASDAVTAAVAFQNANTAHNEGLGDDVLPVVRIGIAMGEVVVADNTVTGEGVVLAQRLEQLAEPGGVCLQDAAYQTVPKRLPFTYENLGERELKGFGERLRVYAVKPSTPATASEPTVASTGQETALALPDKPSMAVLPFTNMSGDPEQEYFSDGITEDIITELSRFREMFVIARNSSFTFKGQATNISEVAQKLGVQYILEGSIQRASNQIRVTAQLVDAATGNHLWAERYDRELTDIFAVQDEISQTIVSTLAGRLKVASQERAKRKPSTSPQAYELVLKAQSVISDTRENNQWSREIYEQAIDLDSECVRAYSNLAMTYYFDWVSGWSDSPESSYEKAFELSKKALSLDDADSKLHWRIGQLHQYRREFDEARRHLERALSINPNDVDAIVQTAIFLNRTGEHEKAIEYFQTAMRLNPYYPGWYLWCLAIVYYDLKQYDKVFGPLQEAINRNPRHMAMYRLLAATHAQLGHLDEARAVVSEILRHEPNAHIDRGSDSAYKDIAYEQHWTEGLRKAGLPE